MSMPVCHSGGGLCSGREQRRSGRKRRKRGRWAGLRSLVGGAEVTSGRG